MGPATSTYVESGKSETHDCMAMKYLFMKHISIKADTWKSLYHVHPSYICHVVNIICRRIWQLRCYSELQCQHMRY